MTGAAQAKTPGSLDVKEIEKFLYAEADCLDRADLDAWIQLYAEDGVYWMPASEDQPDAVNHISIMYDNRTLMEVRRHYLKHPLAPSLDYKLRCSHIISNVRIEHHDESSDLYSVRSNFQAVVYYKTQTLFAGVYTHELVRQEGSFLIKSKRVDLINCDANHRSLLIYV